MKYYNLNQQFNLHFCRSELVFPLYAAIIKHTVPLTTEYCAFPFGLFHFLTYKICLLLPVSAFTLLSWRIENRT